MDLKKAKRVAAAFAEMSDEFVQDEQRVGLLVEAVTILLELAEPPGPKYNHTDDPEMWGG